MFTFSSFVLRVEQTKETTDASRIRTVPDRAGLAFGHGSPRDALGRELNVIRPAGWIEDFQGDLTATTREAANLRGRRLTGGGGDCRRLNLKVELPDPIGTWTGV